MTDALVQATATTAAPTVAPDRSGSRMSETVYQTMLSWIVSGRIGPGEAVNELAIARALGVSRTPVHEAVCALVADGLIAQEANRRRMVARFSPADVHDIFEMRHLLESEAARRAARNLDRPTLARLRADHDAVGDIHAGEPSVAAWTEVDDRFHAEIAAACGSPRLSRDILRYRTLHRALNAVHSDEAAVEQALGEHRGILDALEARDGERAAAEMARHIREWQAFFTRRVEAG